MKTQVIHLDLHDDFVSIRDRMAWAKSSRILLVWPRRGRVELRPLDITLLRRHAESLGAELGLVTRNGEIRSAAREAGASFFSSIADAQKKEWREKLPIRPVRRFPRVNLRSERARLPAAEFFHFMADPVRRLAVFAAGVLAVLLVMLVFIPSAEINVIPLDQQQVLTIAVSTEPETKAVELSGIVPQHRLTVILESSDSVLATGKALIPDQTSSGEVLLMNLTDKAVSVVPGLVLIVPNNPAVSFVTLDPVKVPAGKGKTATAAIRANTAGSAGNVIPGAISSVQGPLGQSLAVTNPAPIKGGSQNELPIPTETDHAQLKKRLLTALEQQARAHFWEQGSNGDLLLPASFSLTRILDETLSPSSGQTGKKLSINLRAEYSVAYVSLSDLNLLAKRVLDASLPAGTFALPRQVTLENLTIPSTNGKVTRWQVRAARSVRPKIDPGQVISLVIGKAAGRAGSLLVNNYGLAQAPQIRIQPAWWPWLPFLPIRISVTG